MQGDSVLIDPLGRKRCRNLSGYQAVLITHAHVDHLNRWTLKSLDKSATLVVPQGALGIVDDLGFAKVREVEPGDQIAVGAMEITVVPTKHDAGRWRRGDLPLCCGYIISKAGLVVYHAGDIDMSTYEVFEDIGRDHAIDTCLLPIGGMLPVWYYRMRQGALDRGVHIDPDSALNIASILGAKTLLPIHWGTVNLRLGPLRGPATRLRRVADEQHKRDLIKIIGHGEALKLHAPLAQSAASET